MFNTESQTLLDVYSDFCILPREVVSNYERIEEEKSVSTQQEK